MTGKKNKSCIRGPTPDPLESSFVDQAAGLKQLKYDGDCQPVLLVFSSIFRLQGLKDTRQFEYMCPL